MSAPAGPSSSSTVGWASTSTPTPVLPTEALADVPRTTPNAICATPFTLTVSRAFVVGGCVGGGGGGCVGVLLLLVVVGWCVGGSWVWLVLVVFVVVVVDVVVNFAMYNTDYPYSE